MASSIKIWTCNCLQTQQIYENDNGKVKLSYADRRYLSEKEEKWNWYSIMKLLAINVIVYILCIFNEQYIMMRRFEEGIQNAISTVWDFTIIDLIRHASNCFSLKTPVRLNIAATCINVILKKSKI